MGFLAVDQVPLAPVEALQPQMAVFLGHLLEADEQDQRLVGVFRDRHHRQMVLVVPKTVAIAPPYHFLVVAVEYLVNPLEAIDVRIG